MLRGMCAACFTSFDALAIGATGATTVAFGGARRVRDWLAGRSPVDRREEARAANRAFIVSLGLDASLVFSAGGSATASPTAEGDAPGELVRV